MEIKGFTNQKFCYWLQGYFEIAKTPSLNEQRLVKIEQQLEKIEEPLGLYTSWLKQVITTVKDNQYNKHLIEYFTGLIRKELNSIFQHDIDTSYETPHSSEYLLKIHNGEKNIMQRENHD